MNDAPGRRPGRTNASQEGRRVRFGFERKMILKRLAAVTLACLWTAMPAHSDAAMVGPPGPAEPVPAAVLNDAGVARDEQKPDAAAGSGEAVPGVVPAQELLSLGRDRSARTAGGAGEEAAAGRSSLLDHWAVRTAGSLAIVIGLAVLLRMLARSVAGHAGGVRGQLGAGGRAPSGVLSILARFPIARGQTLVLLQLDRRVLLLNQTPAGFATLTELVDAEEVASIVRKCEAGSRNGRDGAGGFDTVLRAMERDPEVATGRLDGGAPARRAATAGEDNGPKDPISRAQALLQASRRGNAAMGGGAG